MKKIKLTNRKKPKLFNLIALVDDDDYDLLAQSKWYPSGIGRNARAVKYENKKAILMHRLILGLLDSKTFVDHKDRNGLNNQKSNLRTASYSQNGANRIKTKNKTSVYLGVYRDAYRWRSCLRKNNKTIHLGSFANEIDAAKAYNAAAIIHHGDFANLNIF